MLRWLSRSWGENYIWTWKGRRTNSALQQLSFHLLRTTLTEKKQQKSPNFEHYWAKNLFPEIRRDRNKLCWVCTRAHIGYFPGCAHQINIRPLSNMSGKECGNTYLPKKEDLPMYDAVLMQVLHHINHFSHHKYKFKYKYKIQIQRKAHLCTTPFWCKYLTTLVTFSITALASRSEKNFCLKFWIL